jgi:hypothetical protein
MRVGAFIKPDRARRIDRVIDYFGGAGWTAAPITPFDGRPPSAHERAVERGRARRAGGAAAAQAVARAILGASPGG